MPDLPCDTYPDEALLFYEAGHPLTEEDIEIIVRLANAKMPQPPCGCNVLKSQWEEDRLIPGVDYPLTTRERLNCPYGMRNGAWTAYQYAIARKRHLGISSGTRVVNPQKVYSARATWRGHTVWRGH